MRVLPIMLIGLAFLSFSVSNAAAAGKWQEEAELQPLAKDIAAARQAGDAYFGKVDEIIGNITELDKWRRGPYVVTTPYFQALGAKAFLPMAEALLEPGDNFKNLTAKGQVAAQVGMLEALSKLGDQRAFPVYSHLLKEPAALDKSVLRAAATAMARLRTAESEKYVVDLYNNNKELSEELPAALGQCRTEAATRLLAAEALQPQSATHFRRLTRALGYVVSEWALSTSALRENKEALLSRDIALDALVALENQKIALEDDEKELKKLVFTAEKMASPEALAAARARVNAKAE